MLYEFIHENTQYHFLPVSHDALPPSHPFTLPYFCFKFFRCVIYVHWNIHSVVCEFGLKCDPKSATSKGTWTSVTSIFAFYVWPSLLMLPNSTKLLSFSLQNSFTHSSTAQCHSRHFSVLMAFTHVACLHASLKWGGNFTPYGFRGDSSLKNTRKPPSAAGFHGFR